MPDPAPHLATVTDPEGTTVVLDTDGWTHILAEHGEMSSYRAEIMTTAADPHHREPDWRAGRMRYYRRGIGPTTWLLVVIDFDEVPARVVTAFGKRRDPAGWTPT